MLHKRWESRNRIHVSWLDFVYYTVDFRDVNPRGLLFLRKSATQFLANCSAVMLFSVAISIRALIYAWGICMFTGKLTSSSLFISVSSKNGSAGTRTQNVRLKRPLLYQLSYRASVRLASPRNARVWPKIPKLGCLLIVPSKSIELGLGRTPNGAYSISIG